VATPNRPCHFNQQARFISTTCALLDPRFTHLVPDFLPQAWNVNLDLKHLNSDTPFHRFLVAAAAKWDQEPLVRDARDPVGQYLAYDMRRSLVPDVGDMFPTAAAAAGHRRVAGPGKLVIKLEAAAAQPSPAAAAAAPAAGQPAAQRCGLASLAAPIGAQPEVVSEALLGVGASNAMGDALLRAQLASNRTTTRDARSATNVPLKQALALAQDAASRRLSTWDELQLEVFLAAAQAVSGDEEPQEWWCRVGAINHPRLTLMARCFMTVQVTSVAAERLFSKAGQLLSERRSRLKQPSSVNQILFLHSYLPQVQDEELLAALLGRSVAGE